jgi:hypothetical protein
MTRRRPAERIEVAQKERLDLLRVRYHVPHAEAHFQLEPAVSRYQAAYRRVIGG